jgi:hypothetical protein
MDNNQQDVTPKQGASEKITQGVGPTNADNYSISNRALWDGGYDVTNLGVNEAKPMQGSVQSPLTGADVSMTTGQPYGGPIVSTEVEPNVRREAGPA